MPQLFKIGKYCIYFWSNENNPLEPVHVHISENTPVKHGTKVWITEKGCALLCNNNSNIPAHTLTLLLRIIEANSSDIIKRWQEHFKKITYYC